MRKESLTAPQEGVAWQVTFDVLHTDADWEQMERLSAYATQFFRVWLWHGTEQHSPLELYGSVMEIP